MAGCRLEAAVRAAGATLRQRRCLVVLALVAALAFGLGASMGPAAAQEPRHEVQGTVVGPDGEPLSGVSVRAFGTTAATFGLWWGTTDSAGRFVGRAPDGAYWIQLSLIRGEGECFLGLFDRRGQRVGAIPTPRHQRIVVEGSAVSGVDLSLRASLTELCRAIRGLVTDSEGSPLEDHRMSVGAIGYGGPEGVQTGAAVRADGTFTVYVPEGTHRLSIGTTEGNTCTLQDHASAHEGGGVLVAGTDLAGIRLVVSGPPNPEITRLRCSFPDVPKLEGTVVDRGGNPLAGLTVEAWGATGPTLGPWVVPATDTEGRFAISVPDGSYALQVYREDGGARCVLGYFGNGGVRIQPYELTRNAHRIVFHGGEVAPIGIELRAPSAELCRSIRGTVTDAAGDPLEKVSIIMYGPGESAVERQGAPTGKDGTFHLNAADGLYRVVVVTNAGSECTLTRPAVSGAGGPASIAVGGRDITGVRIVVSGDRRSASEWSRCFFPAPTIETALHPGWNLVGWTGSEAKAAAIFEMLPQLQVAYSWDAEARQFRGAFRNDAGASLGSLSRLKPGMGLWLHIQGDEEVTWTRPVLPQSGLVSLAEGWNLVAWAGHAGIAVEDAFMSLGEAPTSGATWDARSQQFLHYSASAPQQLQPGAGVWIKTAHAQHWLQPGSVQATVEASGDVPQTARRAATDAAQAVMDHFAERYGLLAPGAVFLITGHIEALGGFYYRGTVHLDDSHLRVLPHEYSHALQDSLVKVADTIPAWITEGVANRWSALYDDATGETPYGVHVRDTVLPSARRTPIPLEAMEASLFLEDHAGPNYDVAHLAVDWLVTLAGEDKTFDYYRQRSNYDTWQDAFEAIFGISVDDFYESFAAHRREVTSSR